MSVALKWRIVSALLLLLTLARLTEARSADAPLVKGASPFYGESEAALRRGPRSLSRQEIFQAIQKDLAQRGISRRAELQPGDLNIQSSVPVLRVDMGLQVKKLEFDPIRREVVFELWTSHEPQYLPFHVTTRRDPQTFGLTARPEWGLGEAGEESRNGYPAKARGVSRVPAKSPVLAKPGTPMTLVMLGQNIRITTTVDPLQPGIKGQCILVRDPATMRVMNAEVVDEGLLRTSF
jgi:hypothetical protein